MAIVHEWVARLAGSEQVFEAMAQTFLEADLYAFSATPGVELDLAGRSVQTTAIDRVGALRERRALFLPLMPLLWRSMNAPNYDVIMSSSHAFVRYFPGAAQAAHLCYCHAPMRYAWTPELDGRGNAGGLLGRPVRKGVAMADRHSVQWADSYAANSRAVRNRLFRFYGVDARVIHPPVDVDYFAEGASETKGDYIFAASRWIPYKRLDLAIHAGAACRIPVVIAGAGPEEANLRALAADVFPGGVTFEHHPERDRLRQLMAEARCFVFGANEDFGIIAIEAQAAGTPVLALAEGGSVDTVRPGRTGVLVAEQSRDSFAAGLRELLDANLSSEDCQDWAAGFSRCEFQRKISEWRDEVVGGASSELSALAS